MRSYAELKSQGEALLLQAEELRKQELLRVVAEIRQRMAEYGVTIEDITGVRKRKSSRRYNEPHSLDKGVQYRGPNGECWSGGVGRKPRWVEDILAKGGDLESYRVPGHQLP